MTQHFNHKVGMGLRPPHYPYLEAHPSTAVSWFEAISENYMDSRGRPLEVLTSVRKNYPVALHGVSMNVGSTEGVRLDYLNKLRDLIDQVEPFIVSDHLCWTGVPSHNLHDLLPLPYTEEAIQTVVNNIDFVQNYLHRPMVFENISTYIGFRNNEMSEWEFVTEVTKRSGCALLLDLTNTYINANNHGYDVRDFVNSIPLDRVAQIHLAGPRDYETYMFDTHSEEIPEPIWDLFSALAPRIRHIPISIERDDNIPEFQDLEYEVIKAALILEKSYDTQRTSVFV